MIDSDQFIELVKTRISRSFSGPGGKVQRSLITHDSESILQIVAGPGSGKTTVIVLRALHLVFVNGVRPENILITTFTRRAAREISSRWLDWGNKIREGISNKNQPNDLDLNRVQIDTLDSTMHRVLRECREPGSAPPEIVDESTSNLIFKRQVFQDRYWHSNDSREVIDDLLSRYTFDGNAPGNQGAALKGAKWLVDRLVQDLVDIDAYSEKGDAEATIVGMLKDYREYANETNAFDFGLMAELFLKKLEAQLLDEWRLSLEALFVDEYQDTNPLQEAIYFSIIKSNDVSVTVVGDDDQSMYRFRGASVELFTEFASRCSSATGHQVIRYDMIHNYRSRPEIVSFVNTHISFDDQFQTARINPPKGPIIATRQSQSIGVLGMFREDEPALANDLADFISELVDNRRIFLPKLEQAIELPLGGDVGDIVYLGHSVNEVQYNRYHREENLRFPGLLREELNSRGVQVFNPRGQPLRSIPDVQILLGLLLKAIDPDNELVAAMENNRRLRGEASNFFSAWRTEANRFLGDHGNKSIRKLRKFIADWGRVSSGAVAQGAQSEIPVLEIIFSLITYLPGFQRSPEHQVWLEAVTRIVAGSGRESPYRMWLLQNVSQKKQGIHVKRSRESLIRDALVPIAEDEVSVDEDIMPSVPRDRLQFMTIHQSKGLEFPLVIVDAGTRFKMNHQRQRFLRFPEEPSNVAQVEDDVESYMQTQLRAQRTAIDRTFDDLTRLYYVAYSRAQSILLLVGNHKQLGYQTTIRNIALGWSRNGAWSWQQATTGGTPIRVTTPFTEI